MEYREIMYLNLKQQKIFVIFWPKETLENCINKDDILFYVAETENKIIGFLYSQSKQIIRKSRNRKYICTTRI